MPYIKILLEGIADENDKDKFIQQLQTFISNFDDKRRENLKRTKGIISEAISAINTKFNLFTNEFSLNSMLVCDLDASMAIDLLYIIDDKEKRQLQKLEALRNSIVDFGCENIIGVPTNLTTSFSKPNVIESDYSKSPQSVFDVSPINKIEQFIESKNTYGEPTNLITDFSKPNVIELNPSNVTESYSDL